MKTTHCRSIISRIDFAFLISIIVALCGGWMYLYNLIIEMTVDDKYEICFGISYCHYILTLYLLLALFITFRKGNEIIHDSENKKGGHIFEVFTIFFMNSWLYSVVFAIFTVIYFQIVSWTTDATIFAYMFISILFVGTLVYTLSRSFFHGIIAKAFTTLLGSGALLGVFFIFLYVVSSLALRIEFKTDKDIYDQNDEATIAIYGRGYIFEPYFRVHDYNNFNISGNENCLKVPVSTFKNTINSHIKVHYRNRYVEWLQPERYKFIPIYIKPRDGQYH